MKQSINDKRATDRTLLAALAATLLGLSASNALAQHPTTINFSAGIPADAVITGNVTLTPGAPFDTQAAGDPMVASSPGVVLGPGEASIILHVSTLYKVNIGVNHTRAFTDGADPLVDTSIEAGCHGITDLSPDGGNTWYLVRDYDGGRAYGNGGWGPIVTQSGDPAAVACDNVPDLLVRVRLTGANTSTKYYFDNISVSGTSYPTSYTFDGTWPPVGSVRAGTVTLTPGSPFDTQAAGDPLVASSPGVVLGPDEASMIVHVNTINLANIGVNHTRAFTDGADPLVDTSIEAGCHGITDLSPDGGNTWYLVRDYDGGRAYGNGGWGPIVTQSGDPAAVACDNLTDLMVRVRLTGVNTSTKYYFDNISVSGTPLPDPVITNVALAGGNVTVQWRNGGRLQSTPSLTPPIVWKYEAGMGSYTGPASGAQKLFRVFRQSAASAGPGALEFPPSDRNGGVYWSAMESDGTTKIPVQRTGGSTGAVSVHYESSDGTALVVEDYTAVSGTLNWADGDIADKFISVPLVNDASPEDPETLTLTLSSPTGGATVGLLSAGTLTIGDQDNPGANYVVGSSAASAFDGSIDDGLGWTWAVNPGFGFYSAWLLYYYDTPTNITKYSFYIDGGSGYLFPKTWTFEGWNGTSWVILNTVADGMLNDPNLVGTWVEFPISNSASYDRYCIRITAEGFTSVRIAELKLE